MDMLKRLSAGMIAIICVLTTSIVVLTAMDAWADRSYGEMPYYGGAFAILCFIGIKAINRWLGP